MSHCNRPSILSSSFRALFVSAFAVVGIGVGVFAWLLLFGAASGGGLGRPDQVYVAEQLPNAEGKRKTLSATAPVVLQLDIVGAIGTRTLNAETIRQQLVESREGMLRGRRVKALLLHINSPGGTVSDSFGIYSAIRDYKEKYQVPVYAFVDGLCASGGLYVAAAADRIMASEISLVGSVGVLMPPFFNVKQAMSNLGLDAVTVTAGEGKDALNPTRAWSEAEAKPMQEITDYYYAHFRKLLTESRPQIDADRLVNEYGAGIFPAEAAMERGYVDQADASLGTAIKQLADAANLESGSYVVMRLSKQLWLGELFNEKAPLRTGRIEHTVDLQPQLHGIEGQAGQPLLLYGGS